MTGTRNPGAARAPSGRGRWLPWTAGILLVALCLGVGGWWAGWFNRREDPRVVEIDAMMRELLEKERARQGPATFFTAVEQVSGIVAVGLKVNALPEALRPRIGPLAMAVMMDHLEDRMEAYFKLPTAGDRTRFLDGEMAKVEFFKRAFEAQGKGAGGPPRGPGRPGGPGDGAGGNGQTREQRFTKWVLDRTTPEKRARITEYIAAFERRIIQTGRKLP